MVSVFSLFVHVCPTEKNAAKTPSKDVNAMLIVVYAIASADLTTGVSAIESQPKVENTEQ